MSKSYLSFARAGAIAAALAAGSFAAVPLFAQENPTDGGAPMIADMTIAENASKAPNLSTLVSAVTQAGLAETLSGEGPFTVFAPTNSAFEELREGTVVKVMMVLN